MKKLIIILILLLISAGSYYYINYNNTQVTSETYEYINIEKGNIKKTVSATGKIIPTSTLILSSEISGKIVEIQKDYNEKINKGDVLAIFDQNPFTLNVEETETSVEISKSKLKQKKASLEKAKSELNNSISTGADFGMHQDYPFFPHRDHSTLAAWMPLIDTSIENGALHVVPGSHKLGPIEHLGSSEKGFRLNPDEWSVSKGIPIIAKAGDVILFNYLVIHGSNQNKSYERRTSLIYQFNASTDEPLNTAHHDSSGNGMQLM